MIDARKKITSISNNDINENDIQALLNLIGEYFYNELPQIEYTISGNTITIHCSDGEYFKSSKITILGASLRLRCIKLPEKYQKQGFATGLLDFLEAKCNGFNIKCILAEVIENPNMYKLLNRKNYTVIFFNNEICEKFSDTDYENGGLYDMYLFID